MKNRKRYLGSLFVLLGVVLFYTLSQVSANSVPFGTEQLIATGFSDPFFIATGDIDGDGDLDVVNSNLTDNSSITWQENTAGDGSAWLTHVVATRTASPNGTQGIDLADVDGDGDLDVFSGDDSAGEFRWHENTAGDGSAWTSHVIASGFSRSVYVSAADIDGDNDIDVFSTSANTDEISWHENTAGDGSTWTTHLITTAMDYPTTILSTDMDGDNDVDVLTVSQFDTSLVWHENTAGDGSAWTIHLIADDLTNSSDMALADVDGDGDMDVLANRISADEVEWHENVNGDALTWTSHTIGTGLNTPFDIVAGDIDNDGDVDVMTTASSVLNIVVWFENSAGNGSAWTMHTISASQNTPFFVDLADLDDDGDLDAIASSVGDDKLAWYENTNDPPTADAGGPYIVTEGGSIALDGSGSSDSNQDATTLSYDWDFDGDNQFDDGIGINPTFTTTLPAAANMVTVTLQVTDDGGLTDTQSTVVSIRPASLAVEKDSFLHSGKANINEGANPNMVVRPGGDTRPVLSFDISELASVVNSSNIATASLRLYIVHNGDNWSKEGRTIDVHDVTEAWEEGNRANFQPGNLTEAEFAPFETDGNGSGVTWRCAIDSDIQNKKVDCSPEWGGGTFDPVASDSVTIFKDFAGNNNLPPTTKTMGWISFDVTEDLQTCLTNGDQECDWLIKKTLEDENGRVEFASQEGAAALYDGIFGEPVSPQLQLTYRECFATPDDGATIFYSLDATALQDAIDAASSEAIVKVSGICGGVQTVSGQVQSAYVTQDMTLQGGWDSTFSNFNPVLYPTTIDAEQSGRVVYVPGGVTAQLSHLNLINGSAAGQGGGSFGDAGGGVYLANGANAVINQSKILNNTAVNGAGIYSQFSTNLTVDDSQISFNVADNFFGGGIFTDGILTVRDTTIDHNMSIGSNGGGGAIFNGSGLVTISNSTLSHNHASTEGGAIVQFNTAQGIDIINSTIVNNTTDGVNMGGGIWTNDQINLSNTIVANNSNGDCTISNDGSINTGGLPNLDSDGTCGASITADPQLGPLEDNGGLTPTHALQSGSPAIDAGDNITCVSAPINNLDQRGVPRPQNGICDIGAFESVLN